RLVDADLCAERRAHADGGGHRCRGQLHDVLRGHRDSERSTARYHPAHDLKSRSVENLELRRYDRMDHRRSFRLAGHLRSYGRLRHLDGRQSEPTHVAPPVTDWPDSRYPLSL